MGIGKIALIGFGGFMLMGLVAMPFIPEMSPEEDMASAQRYFASQCSDVTRNQQINGRFGRGHVYCDCIQKAFAPYAETGDEVRLAADLQTAAGTERWFFRDTRAKSSVRRVAKRYSRRLDSDRIDDVSYVFFDRAATCARKL
ncbi:MAG: hypothetical protein AAF441_05760 [Pseudomonadota bacterium]